MADRVDDGYAASPGALTWAFVAGTKDGEFDDFLD
jgi:hypothetical protein